MTISAYLCPVTREEMTVTPEGLRRRDGRVYPFLSLADSDMKVPNFLESMPLGDLSRASMAQYDEPDAVRNYRNFLRWLFATFRTDEADLRRFMIAKLRLEPGARVLVTGCGLGSDLPYILDRIGDGAVYAQDIAPAMVAHAAQTLTAASGPKGAGLHFFVGDAVRLPFRDGWFDAAFHFGGINLFDDVPGAIQEMNRVVRADGRVAFGDEGVAPWLRDTEYGRIVTTNNALWAHEPPIAMLPHACCDVSLSWILGNCFWLIDFTKKDRGPDIDMDVPHLGPRGGTMRTRYFGRLEGVSPKNAELARQLAAEQGVSVHEWLNDLICNAASQDRTGGR